MYRFLLAKLHLDSLKGKRSPRELKKALSNLATGKSAYDGAYGDTMQRIYGQILDQKELAMSVLMWIVHTKRPLKTSELQHALSVELGELVFLEDNLPDIDDMVSACCGLVTVDEESQIIRLIHYTTQEFFERKGLIFFPDAQGQIASVCVTYLLFDVFGSGRCNDTGEFLQRLADFPLFEYASAHWGHHATSQEDSELIQRLLTQQGHVQACSQALMAAKFLRQLQLRNDYDYYWSNIPLNISSLHLAASFGLTSMMSYIMDDFDPDLQDSRDRTPVLYAAKNGHHAAVSLLLDSHCQPDIADVGGRTPLFWAAMNGHETVVRLLLDNGVQLEQTDKQGRTPLWIAVVYGHESIVHLLLHKGANIETADEDGRAILSMAIRTHHSAMARMLLDRGAQVESKDMQGRTPLMYAVDGGSKIAARLLLRRGAQVEKMDQNGRTPLFHAASRGYEGIVSLFIRHKTGLNVPVKEISLLSIASERGHTSTAGFASEQSAMVNTRCVPWGLTPLMSAAASNHLHVIKLLLAAGADYKMTDICARPALMHAVGHHHLPAVEVLLGVDDIDPNVQDIWGSTAVSFAARLGLSRVFKNTTALANVDLLLKDSFGRSALWWARKQGHEGIVRDIIELNSLAGMDTSDGSEVPAMGQPRKFRNLGWLCDVCWLQSPDSYYHCDDCADGDFDICRECYELGARCLVQAHKLSIKEPLVGISPGPAR